MKASPGFDFDFIALRFMTFIRAPGKIIAFITL